MARIEMEKEGPVGVIRLNRPEVLNAMGRDWPADMLSAAAAMNEDPEIRVVLVTGEGRAFCSGLDLSELVDGEISARWFHEAELAYRALETMSKPVIAGIHGYCLGGGVQIAIACDIRIAADDSIIALPAAQEAFIPGMATWRLPRLIGAAHARHLILSGESIRPEEACRIGLVNRVVARSSLENELREWAGRYKEVPATTLKLVKQLTNLALDLPFADFLEEMDRAMGIALASEEHLAARQAWRERRDRRRRPAGG
jgi:enoyl-CoA hydratase/carnithine racemase